MDYSKYKPRLDIQGYTKVRSSNYPNLKKNHSKSAPFIMDRCNIWNNLLVDCRNEESMDSFIKVQVKGMIKANVIVIWLENISWATTFESVNLVKETNTFVLLLYIHVIWWLSICSAVSKDILYSWRRGENRRMCLTPFRINKVE